MQSITNQDFHVLQQQSMVRARMPHGPRHPRHLNTRCPRQPPPGYMLHRGPPRFPPGVSPPWAHGGQMRPGVGPRQFRPFHPSSVGQSGIRSPAGSPLVSPRGPGHPYVPRRGGPPPPGFIGYRGPPRHRGPRAGLAMSAQNPYARHPDPSSVSTNGNHSRYYSAPSSPVLKLQQETIGVTSDKSVNPELVPRTCAQENDNCFDTKLTDYSRENVHEYVKQIRKEFTPENSDSRAPQAGTSNSRFSSCNQYEDRSEDKTNEYDNQMHTKKDSDNLNEQRPNPEVEGINSVDDIINEEVETGASPVQNEDSSNFSKGASELQQHRAYKPAKPLYETKYGTENRFKSTWRRLSSVRKNPKGSKRNKPEQRTGADRRGTICAQSELDNSTTGCDKFSVDNSPTLNRSLEHNSPILSGNLENVISSGISPSQSGNMGLSVAGATFEGNSSGNQIRPPSTTSRESETEGVVTSGYFR